MKESHVEECALLLYVEPITRLIVDFSLYSLRCTTLVKHLEKYAQHQNSRQGREPCLEELMKILSQLVIALFSMHRNLSGQFIPPPPPLYPIQAPQPPLSLSHTISHSALALLRSRSLGQHSRGFGHVGCAMESAMESASMDWG